MRRILTLFTVLMLSGAFALIPSEGFSQNGSFSGRITDANGVGIPNISVQLRGTNLGTSTNTQGDFTIAGANRSSGTLEISGVGYATQSVKATSGSPVNLTLQISNQNLQEVVVTALGFQVRRDKAATSQSTVKGTAIVNSGEVSLLNGLASKASGLQVVRSGGDPGASVYIQVRGQNSISGTQPLFIVDGVPVNNTTAGSSTTGVQQQSRLNDLNPEDIASVDVLKSAAAGALYGSRAANGVIIITTKKGKNSGGKINISLASTYSSDVVNKRIPLQTTFGQGLGGRFLYGQPRSWGDKIADRTGGADTYLTTGDYIIFPDGTKRYRIASGTAANVHGGKNDKSTYDHFGELFHTGSTFENTLSLNGGDDKSTFYVSVSNTDQKGTLIANSDYHKKSAFINADRKFGKNVKLAGSVNYSNVKSNRTEQGSNLSGTFLGGVRTPPDFNNYPFEGNYVSTSGAIYPNRQPTFRSPIGANSSASSDNAAPGFDNPIWQLNRIKSTTDVDRFVTNFEGTVDATNWLQFIARAGVDYYNDHRLDFYPIGSGENLTGALTIQDLAEHQFNTNLIAKATRSFSDNFSATALVGYNYNSRVSRNIGAGVIDLILPTTTYNLTNSPTSSRNPFNSETTTRSNAGYGSVNMEIYNQLFVELTGRYDVYSTTNFGQFYPSASVGWQFTKLKPFESQKALSFGKLRLTYGKVGVEPPAYAFNNYFLSATDVESWGPALDAAAATYGSGGFVRSTVKGNPDIKPEVKTEYEAGLDLRFWKDRISLSGTYYQNHTDDVVISTQVPSSTGFTNSLTNAAKLKNKGFEADLGVTWLKSRNLSFSSNFIYSTNKNTVVSLAGTKSIFLAGFTGVSSRLVEGEAYGALWGIDFLKDSKGALVLDANGFPQSAGVEGVLADPNPDWTGAINSTLRYKNLSLSFLFDHVQGGSVWNGTRGALLSYGTHAQTATESVAPSALKTVIGTTIPSGTTFRGIVQNFGAGPVALEENWYRGIGGGFGPVGTDFIEDGTRTRLREVSVGFSLNGPQFRSKTKLQSIDFSITGRNLALWTDYTGIDPETNLTGPSRGRGLDYFQNPNTRSVLFTVRINY